jgi:protein-disulfide isomerase
MNFKHVWLVALVAVALVVSACGPQMATPTPVEEAAAGESPTRAEAAQAPTATQVEDQAQEPPSAAELPVDPDDWHVLGSPDAPVTIVEYADFQ